MDKKFDNLKDIVLWTNFIWSIFQISLFHRAFRFTKIYLYQRMHLFLSYTKIT